MNLRLMRSCRLPIRPETCTGPKYWPFRGLAKRHSSGFVDAAIGEPYDEAVILSEHRAGETVLFPIRFQTKTMLPIRLQTIIAAVVLANYAAILTIGQGLHQHGHRTIDPHEAAGPHTVCCATADRQLPDLAIAEERSPDETIPTWQQDDTSLAEATICTICRFLSKKPVPAFSPRLIQSAPFVGRVEPAAVPVVFHPCLFNGDIRGPPAIV